MNSHLTLEEKHIFDDKIRAHHALRALTQVHRYPELAHMTLLQILKILEGSKLSPLHQEELIQL